MEENEPLGTPEIWVTVEVLTHETNRLDHEGAQRIADAVRPALKQTFEGARIVGLWVHSIETIYRSPIKEERCLRAKTGAVGKGFLIMSDCAIEDLEYDGENVLSLSTRPT